MKPIRVLQSRRPKWRSALSCQQGLETVEYAIMLGLIVAGLLLAVAAIGEWTNVRFNQANAALSPPPGGPPGPGPWGPGGPGGGGPPAPPPGHTQ